MCNIYFIHLKRIVFNGYANVTYINIVIFLVFIEFRKDLLFQI